MGQPAGRGPAVGELCYYVVISVEVQTRLDAGSRRCRGPHKVDPTMNAFLRRCEHHHQSIYSAPTSERGPSPKPLSRGRVTQRFEWRSFRAWVVLLQDTHECGNDMTRRKHRLQGQDGCRMIEGF